VYHILGPYVLAAAYMYHEAVIGIFYSFHG
jgi:hypothetical protein